MCLNTSTIGRLCCFVLARESDDRGWKNCNCDSVGGRYCRESDSAPAEQRTGAPMKMMLGCILQAKLKMALTSFWLSPNHFDMMELARMFTNMAPDSFASACSARPHQTSHARTGLGSAETRQMLHIEIELCKQLTVGITVGCSDRQLTWEGCCNKWSRT